MNKISISLLLVLLSGTLVFGSGNPVMKETEKGKMIEVSVVKEGTLNLYTHESVFIPATVPQDPSESFTRTYITYYLSRGEGNMVEVHCSNYKKVLRAELADKPEIASKIGKKGYKLSDIEDIVSAYNNH